MTKTMPKMNDFLIEKYCKNCKIAWLSQRESKFRGVKRGKRGELTKGKETIVLAKCAKSRHLKDGGMIVKFLKINVDNKIKFGEIPKYCPYYLEMVMESNE